MTIVDVATLANVSTATVSRVLNGTPVRPDLADAVRTAITELNYSPNRTARTLRRGQSTVLALILPDVENPFFTSVARGVEDVTQQHSYSVVLCNSDDNLNKERQYLEIVTTHDIAGVILCPAAETSSLRSELPQNIPAVVIDRPTLDDVDHILPDDAGTTVQAVRALIDAGYERIACLTGPQTTVTARIRAEMWRAELYRNKLEAPDDYLIYANFRVSGGEYAAERMLRLPDPPDAFVATNNLVAVGILRVLANRGSTPPSTGLSVVGDLPFAATPVGPGFYTFPLPARELGVHAARILMDRIEGRVTGPGRHFTLLPGNEPTLTKAHKPFLGGDTSRV